MGDAQLPRRPLTVGAPAADIVARDVARALAEDIGSGDASAALIATGTRGCAEVVAREAMVLAGSAWFDACLRMLDPDARIDWRHHDGDHLAAGEVLCEIEAEARALLSGERSALNFLQTLSGTATTTAAYVALTAGSNTRLLDTRKTLPGLRYAQKYAVRVGGAQNHRLGLYDAVLIKENHIIAAGGIGAAIRRARELSPSLEVEIEVESLAEYREALAAGPDRIMLDELVPDELRQAIAERVPGVELELSGGVEHARLAELCQLGVDYISIGALTKHLRAIDLSLRWRKRG
ncbi:MAG: carboxylating nicotinate-nucleotide diphosphorylase [Rhodanobacteraceae bacterium]|nr:carboxylating nicotinate-nucleotide diphosphorylase [Rhodanobacteraceae bacterium]